MQPLKISLFIISLLITTCNIAMGIYEFLLSLSCIYLYNQYHDQLVPKSATDPILVSINTMPQNVFKTIETVSYALIGCSVPGLVLAAGALGCTHYKRSVAVFVVGTSLAAIFIIAGPLCIGCYLSWKLWSLSNVEKSILNNVDTEFVNILIHGQNLMLLTIIGCIIESIIVCIVTRVQRCQINDEL